MALFIAYFFAQMIPVSNSGEATLKAQFSGLKELSGKLAIQLLDEQGDVAGEYWIPVYSDSVELEVQDLENGRYAMKFFHDANNNGIMDVNIIGIPKESFGFSNDPRVITGIPDLREMLFTVEGNTQITIKAKRF